jgi:hypothetical protein
LDGFELLHNILYYLYTGTIILQSTTNLEVALTEFHLSSIPTCLPTIRSAEDIYSAAKFYRVNDLEEKAFDFLDQSCDIENITGRVFGKFCNQHTEVDEIWSKYFKDNLDEILETESYEQYFTRVKGDSKEEIAANAKFRKLVSERARPAKKRRVE